MDEVDFIFQLFAENKGRIERLQKKAYERAQRINHELLSTFKKNYFGMYSEKVDRIVVMLIGTNFIDRKQFKTEKGNILRYFLTEDGLFICIAEGLIK